METCERLSIYGEVAIELRILTLEKLPHRRPDPDDTGKKPTLSPVVRIYRRILIDRMITHIRLEECGCHYHEKMLLHLGIGIDRRDECMTRVERLLSLRGTKQSRFLTHSLILLDRIRDIGSLHLSLSLDI